MINNANTEKTFNSVNLYGFGYNYANITNKELANSNGKSGMNNVTETKKSVQQENPHTNLYEITNLAGYGNDTIRQTKYKPTIIDQLQYIQPPNNGYTNNRNLGILNSIASTKTKEYNRHHTIGAETELLIDERD